jgi:hypothetical protein
MHDGELQKLVNRQHHRYGWPTECGSAMRVKIYASTFIE